MELDIVVSRAKVKVMLVSCISEEVPWSLTLLYRVRK